jgi:formylglycine-generating enzyme required for sulfatase activity
MDRLKNHPDDRIKQWIEQRYQKDCAFRVLRDGSGVNGVVLCRLSFRLNRVPDFRRNTIGFRLARLPGQCGEPRRLSQGDA